MTSRAAYTFLPVRIAKKTEPAFKQPEDVVQRSVVRHTIPERKPESVIQTIVLERKPEPAFQTIVLESAPEPVSGATRTVEAATHPQTKTQRQTQTIIQNAAKPEVSGQSQGVYQIIKVRAKRITRNLLRKLTKQQRRGYKAWRKAVRRIRAGRR